MNNKINHLGVWILVVVYFLIGWGWYAILGEKWLNLHARTMTDIERTHNVSAYLLAFVAAIFVNYALAWLISRVNAANAMGDPAFFVVNVQHTEGSRAKKRHRQDHSPRISNAI